MYHLPHHVFFCFSGSHCVFLDIHRDRYLAVDREPIEALTPWLSSRSSAIEHPNPAQEIPSAAAAAADELLTEGLLTTSDLDGKPFRSVSAATLTLRSRPLWQQPLVINAIRFRGFYSACRAANGYLSTSRTRDAIEVVRGRKTRNCRHASVARTHLLSLLSSFDALRPLYPRPYLCLFDSLALIEFLARYGIFPTWVFGVRGEPFQAHCWVQHDTFLLNDTIDHIATFTPIMTV